MTPGSRLPGPHGHYELQTLLGQGPHGEVWSAISERDPDAGLAIKFLRSSRSVLTHYPGKGHPCLATAYAFLDLSEWTGNGWPPACIVTTKYPLTLAKVLALCAARKQPLPWELAIHYASTLAAALDALHDDRFVHRNLKPSNIFIRTPAGTLPLPGHDLRASLAGSEALIGDLGLVTEAGQSDGSVLPQDGWKAPEVACGAVVAARPAEDVFALGKVLERLAAAVGNGHGNPAGLLRLTTQSCMRQDPQQRPTARTLHEEILRTGYHQLPARYEVRKKLGKGGFGVVYLAEDNELCRLVAIKVLDEGTELEEARQIASLRHRGIIEIHDVGRLPDGALFLVMPYAEGGSLEGLLIDDPARPGRHVPLAPVRVAALLRPIAEALAYLHERDLVHEDVKPANILLFLDGDSVSPRLADFGLVRRRYGQRMGEADGRGTPSHMSPEQVAADLAQADPARPPVDHLTDGRTDVWAVGVILFQLLTGEHPFYQRGDTKRDVENKILVHTPPDPREINPAIPDRLAQICRACLSKAKAGRPRAEELARQLGEVEAALSLEVDLEPTREMRAQVERCPRYVSVPDEWVFPEWLRIFGRLRLEYNLALALVEKAIRLRRSVDPDATVCEPGHGREAPRDAFWSDVLLQAGRCHGPRMLAALVVVIPPGTFTDENRESFLQSRAKLLERLRNLTW